MTLESRLEALRERSRSYVPPEAKQIMARATSELRDSGILDRVPQPGQPAPSFALANTRGETISSADLLGSSALVLTFYRGFW